MKKIPIALPLFITLTFAQSFFNLQCLGELTPPGDGYIVATGNHFALGVANPGIFIDLSQTSLKISLSALGVIGKQNNMTRALGSVKPSAFYGAVPLPSRTRILLGVDSRFNQDFDVWSESISDTTYRYHIIGRGGIYSLNLGLAQSFLSHFCLGAQFHQLLGGSRENWHFCTPEGSIATDTIEIDYSARNIRLGASARYSIFTIATSYDLPINLLARRSKLIHGIAADSLRTYRIKLPSVLTFGFSAGPYHQTRLNLGCELRPWSDAKINDTNCHYRNTWRGAIGLEYELFPEHPVRLGYSYNNWYCDSKSTNRPITESGLHLGTGVPIPKFGALDIAGEIIFRSSQTSSGILSETAGRLIFTLAYQETWAKRTRRWGY